MKIVLARQLSLEYKVKIGDSRVIPTNPHNAFCDFIAVYFTFRNVKIHKTVALCQKKTQFATVTKSLISRACYKWSFN